MHLPALKKQAGQLRHLGTEVHVAVAEVIMTDEVEEDDDNVVVVVKKECVQNLIRRLSVFDELLV